MPEARQCSRCSADLDPRAAQGLCPRCLIALSLTNPSEVPTACEDFGADGRHDSPQTQRVPLPQEIARLFPHLEILELLGQGGMGLVYKARQPQLNRWVALKLLAPEKEANPRFAERFAREAQALARLNHPNIVTVYDFGQVEGRYYLLMEFVDGVSLRQSLRAGKVSAEIALGIASKICDALQYAHQQGVVHRDIKPENILRDREGRVKLADFGIAKMVSSGQGAITQDQVVGTPHYMAPEQVEKPELVDHRADIYSLGVVFYEMLTGELPLGKFQPPSHKVPIDAQFDQVVLRALAKEPDRRYRQVRDFKTDLETIAMGKTGSHAAVPSPPARSRSGAWKLTGAAAALLLLFALPLVKGWRHAHLQHQPQTAAGSGLVKAGVAQKLDRLEITAQGVAPRAYLGGFVEQPLMLTAKGLPEHKLLHLTFDLFLVGSWDGSYRRSVKKAWSLRLADGRSLLHTTFSTGTFSISNGEQAFPDSYPCRPHPASTGSIQNGVPEGIPSWSPAGLAFEGPSVYHFSLIFPHSNSEAVVEFEPPLPGHKDRNYGIGNLQMHTLAEVVPLAEPQLASLWQDLGSTDSQRFFKAQWDLVAAGEAAVEFLARHLNESIDLPEDRIQNFIRELASAEPGRVDQAQASLIAQGRSAQTAVARAIDDETTPQSVIPRLVEIQWAIARYPETLTELRRHRARQLLLAIHTPAARVQANRISAEPQQNQPPIADLVAAANAAGGIGDWPKAFALFQQVLAAGGTGERDWSSATAVALAVGETNAHVRWCRGYLRRFGQNNDPIAAERCAKMCLASPWVTGDVFRKALDLADFAAKTWPEDEWSQVAKAMAEFRRGRASEALLWLRRPQASSLLDLSTLAWCFSALAHHKLGNLTAANLALQQANRRLAIIAQTGELSEYMPDRWDNFARACALRAEAERLILGREVSPPLDPERVAAGAARWQPIIGLFKSGEELAAQRRWGEASDAFTTALGQPGFCWPHWELKASPRRWLGPIALLATNEARYVDLCRSLLDCTNAETPLVAAEAYASVYLARSGALPPDLRVRALEYARRTCQRAETERSPLLALLRAMIAYQEGRYTAALEALVGTEAIGNPAIKARALLMRGQASFRLGQIEEAQRALDRAEPYFAHASTSDPAWWGAGLAEVALQDLRMLLGARQKPLLHLSGAITVGPASEAGRLAFTGSVTAEELAGVVDLAVSTNGLYLYSASYVANTVGVYGRDTNSGQLTPLQFVKNDPDLIGAISIRLSPDQRYAAAAAFRSKSVVLFKREPETGRLERVQAVRRADGIDGLTFPVRARFSSDGKQVYALDGGGMGGVIAFGFDPGKGLHWLQTLTNECTAGGSRALALLPQDKGFVVANHRSRRLTVFDRDPASGRISLRQALAGEGNGASRIEGQFGLTTSPDGNFVYVSSGRFGGDNAVSAFRVNEERKLAPIQAIINGEEGLTFVGGNEVVVSPDGCNAYATATVSGTLACFAREAQTGRLRLIQSFVDDKRTVHLEGPAGLECSPDGHFVYVALEGQKTISIYRREIPLVAR